MKKLLCLCFLLLGFCTKPEQKNKEKQELSLSTEILTYVMFSMPIPLDMAMTFREQKIKYDNKILIPLNLSLVSKEDQAFYMGAYSVNLGYAYLFEDKNYLKYYEKVNNLVEGFGYQGQHNFLTIAQNNPNNIDSLITLAQQSFESICLQRFEPLKQQNLVAFVLVGAWVEYVYLNSVLCEQNPNNKILKDNLGEQKVVLEQLLLVLDIFKKEAKANLLIKELEKLEPHFKKVKIEIIGYQPLSPESKKLIPEESKKDCGVLDLTPITKITFGETPESEKENLENLIKAIQEVRNNLLKLN